MTMVELTFSQWLIDAIISSWFLSDNDDNSGNNNIIKTDNGMYQSSTTLERLLGNAPIFWYIFYNYFTATNKIVLVKFIWRLAIRSFRWF